MSEADRTVTVCSTSRVFLSLDAVNNFKGDVKIGEPKYVESDAVYKSEIAIEMEYDDAKDLLRLLQHQLSECDREECEFCNQEDS